MAKNDLTDFLAHRHAICVLTAGTSRTSVLGTSTQLNLKEKEA